MEAKIEQGFDIKTLDPLDREITSLISKIAEMNETDLWVKKDAHFFKDMEIDSLLALEILASIEKRYGIEIPEERLPEITTLMNTIKLVRSFVN